MPSPEIESNPELTHSEALRDEIFSHLPRQARNALMGAKAKFWPVWPGEMELIIQYTPNDNILDITAEEGIYGPPDEQGSERLTGYFVRDCEMDSNTGEILAYGEFMRGYKEVLASGGVEEVVHFEVDVSRFTEEKQNFFLTLLENM